MYLYNALSRRQSASFLLLLSTKEQTTGTASTAKNNERRLQLSDRRYYTQDTNFRDKELQEICTANSKIVPGTRLRGWEQLKTMNTFYTSTNHNSTFVTKCTLKFL